jgi:GNAT superfamily N-acetyltransferase
VSAFAIRRFAPDDAEAVAGMVAALAAELQAMGDKSVNRFDAAAFRQHGSGPQPAFLGFIAESAGAPVGYLIASWVFEVEHGEPMLYVSDLYVAPALRGGGLGRALMAAAGRLALEAGRRHLVWAVLKQNEAAFAFYRRLGAKAIDDVDHMTMRADAAAALG